MHVHNVHRRTIDANPRQLGALIDGLAGPADRLWPADRWPAMRFDRPLQVGARGGHGPVRYWIEHYEPGRRIRFRLERPRGVDGFHEFHLVTSKDNRPPELVHVLDAQLHGLGRLSWPLVYGPLHDALLEDALDNAERECTDNVTSPATWPPHVRRLRHLLARPHKPSPNHRSRITLPSNDEAVDVGGAVHRRDQMPCSSRNTTEEYTSSASMTW